MKTDRWEMDVPRTEEAWIMLMPRGRKRWITSWHLPFQFKYYEFLADKPCFPRVWLKTWSIGCFRLRLLEGSRDPSATALSVVEKHPHLQSTYEACQALGELA